MHKESETLISKARLAREKVYIFYELNTKETICPMMNLMWAYELESVFY